MTISSRRRIVQITAAAAALAASPRVARAQSYPAKQVRIIVATSAGGTTDIAARLIGGWLSRRLGQPFVVENRPGGGNNIGTEAAVRAPADGYTLFMANTVNAINATLYQNLSYNFATDMAPIAILMRSPLLMQVHPSLPAGTVRELIDHAKANPGKINMGSGGNGATGHVSGELFKMMSGVEMVHVPYRGEALALTDLLGGQVQIVFATVGSSIGYIKAGQLRPLAVTTAMRSDALPDVPPLADFLPGYEASSWNGLCAPKNTPAEIIDKLNREINTALADPKIKARLVELGGPPIVGSPADFGKIIAGDTEKWAKVIKISGAKPN
jgi:tripartite-type tricarboxylate transporter receptor subunit TctC